MEDTNKIYDEELIILIKPLKARVWKDEYQKIEAYTEAGVKVIILREKEVKN